MFPRVPRVNHDMKQNAGITCADGEGSEADCYTVLIHNLYINTLWHMKFCILTGLKDKDLLVNSILYVWWACLAVLVRVGGLRKSMEIRLIWEGEILVKLCVLLSLIYLNIQSTLILKRTQLKPVQRIYTKLNYKFLPNGPTVVESVKQGMWRGSYGMWRVTRVDIKNV